MKKLIFVLAVAFTASLYSCGNKAAEEATEAAPVEEAAVVEETVVEAAPVDSNNVEAPVEAPAETPAAE